MQKHVKNPAQFLVDSGLLFEINRKVLHPFGLALEVQTDRTDATGECTMTRLWDCRDDPEGIDFGEEDFTRATAKLAATVEAARPRLESRRQALGFVIQGMAPDQTAQRAYAAYGASTGWKNFLGQPMPKWEDLPETIKQAWRDATKAVVEP